MSRKSYSVFVGFGIPIVLAIATFGCSAATLDDVPIDTEDRAAQASADAFSQGDAALQFAVGTEDCCFTHFSSGCFVADVQECVCDLAEGCCLSDWADECVALAANTCNGCFDRPFLRSGVAARSGGATGYCAFNGGKSGGSLSDQSSGGGFLIGLLSIGGWFARRRRRGTLRRTRGI